MKADGLVELTNSMVCYGVSLALFVSVNLYKRIATSDHEAALALIVVPQKASQKAETSMSYILAWILTCLLVPLFSHSIFAEVYSMKGGVADATVTIISSAWLFMLAIIVWIYMQWIVRVRAKWVYAIYFAFVTIVYIVLIFFVFGALRTFQAEHLLFLAFSIPLALAMDASRRSNNYRDQYEKTVKASTTGLTSPLGS